MSNKPFSVVIPSYNPDEKLLTVVQGLETLGVKDIIIVNDGSRSDCIKYFDMVKDSPSVTLITHDVNKGKGAALKTAFKYILENRNEISGCVTADGDAQHLPKDIIACGELLSKSNSGIVLGVRDFSLPHVPPRSRIGNRITSAVFKIFVGMKISDTQTGLRAFPLNVLPKMLEINGDRYEYETNMLLEIKKKSIPYSEKTIETVYIEENKTSHFNPIKDSWRIYKLILAHFFKYTLSAILSLIIEQLIQTSIFIFANGRFIDILTEVISFVPARVISSIFNFILNKKYVFSSKVNSTRALIRYYTLWFFQMLITMVLDWSISFALLNTDSSIVYTAISLAIKLIIAIISFRIQKDWVFNENYLKGE